MEAMKKRLHLIEPDVGALVQQILEQPWGWDEILREAILPNLSTTGSGDIANADELFMFLDNFIEQLLSEQL